MSTVYIDPPPQQRASEAELAEIRRREAEDRLGELAAMFSALSRPARKIFWEEHSEEVIHLSRVETRKGIAWTKQFLP